MALDLRWRRRRPHAGRGPPARAIVARQGRDAGTVARSEHGGDRARPGRARLPTA